MADPGDPLRARVRAALTRFTDLGLKDASISLFEVLGYDSRKTAVLDGKPSSFLGFFDPSGSLGGKPFAHVSKWREVEFLFQLTNDELPTLAHGQQALP